MANAVNRYEPRRGAPMGRFIASSNAIAERMRAEAAKREPAQPAPVVIREPRK